ncbi:MAG: YHS domain protein [Flammeovirgaceae bacterium]|nr:YHS domain protein [Flammeovirgaceae bacterium]
MKTLIFSFLLSQLLQGSPAEMRLTHFNVKDKIAISGYDPVSYFESKPTEGKKEFFHIHEGVHYYFASIANRNTFKANPEKYEPAYGGWCAFAMGDSGEKVKVDPETYKISNGKLFLFYNFWTTNTLTSWNKNEPGLKASADKNWNAIYKK